MHRSYRRALRYARSWTTHRSDLVERETTIVRDGRVVPATTVRPRSVPKPLPGWIVLHGITRPGRAHGQLRRFMHAAASTGAVLIVPEVHEWRELGLAPTVTAPTVIGAMDTLDEDPDVDAGPHGLMGFSFGAPHAIAAAGNSALRDRVAGAVGFGGYCDLARTFQFLMTGRHEHDGKEYHVHPDPYGRWIVGANYLAAADGYRDAEDVAGALGSLAALAGDTGTPAWDSSYDSAIASARRGIAKARRSLFDEFAPASGREPDAEVGEGLAEALVRAARTVEPTLDPRPALGRVRTPVHILHGRGDHLIPFTEALRLRDALDQSPLVNATVTGLFGHSEQDAYPSLIDSAREIPLFLRALAAIFATV